MSFSYTALLMSTLFSCIMIILMYVILNSDYLLSKINYKFLLLFPVLITIRLLLPFEFGHTITIPSNTVLPFIKKILSLTIFSEFNITIHISQLIIMLWIIGIFISIANIVRSYYKVRKFSYCCSRLETNETKHIAHLFSNLTNDRIEIRNLKIIKTGYVSTPILSGFIHPVILLPDIDFTDTELVYILSHELSHLKNHDLWWMLCLELLTAVFWWNPFAYLFKKQFSKILELHTDSMVNQKYDDVQHAEYLECLLKVRKYQLHQKNFEELDSSSLLLTFSNIKNTDLIKRMKYLTHKHSFRTSIPFLISFVLVFLCSTAIILEPCFPLPSSVTSETFTIDDSDKGYLVINQDQTYRCYINGKFVGTFNNPKDDAVKNFPIYDNLEDAITSTE